MVIADRFRLQRELGKGGMGAVWLAHHVSLDTPCAVKFIHAESASSVDVRSRFEREARSAAQLRSANVVGIMDYGVWNDMPYIAMEYLEGEDLAARLKSRGRLGPLETASILTQVARALTKAHAANLVHRDLKPENIFLVREDDHEVAKVLDFGIAKGPPRAMDSSTRTGAILGTPFYLSPEQAQGTKTVDYRSDLWSLAVVAFRCVTGVLPFTSDAFGDLLLKIIVNPLPIPSQVAPGVPPAFDAWWAHAASRDPAGRFQSAKELAESLAVALGVGTPMSGVTPYGPSQPQPAAQAPGFSQSQPGQVGQVGQVGVNVAAAYAPQPTQSGLAMPTPAPGTLVSGSPPPSRLPLTLFVLGGALLVGGSVGAYVFFHTGTPTSAVVAGSSATTSSTSTVDVPAMPTVPAVVESPLPAVPTVVAAPEPAVDLSAVPTPPSAPGHPGKTRPKGPPSPPVPPAPPAGPKKPDYGF
jgi:serine/threonine-protein kinase